jgi:hypothetical protein
MKKPGVPRGAGWSPLAWAGSNMFEVEKLSREGRSSPAGKSESKSLLINYISLNKSKGFATFKE